ncbi:RcnB family protein [Sphingomonas sp. ID0503]|uniref:RcnB family protein n=1 Tax=Sphingomonas sp. ID0503 TaxID=3399691 RepID=UPI003AFA6DC6
MRKLITSLMIGAVAVPAFATAQSAELRHDRREIRQEQRDLRHAQNHGSRHDVREQRRDVREAKREYRQDWREYRRDHREAYRRPAYVGPRGWSYRPVNVGYRLQPVYYGNRYVVSDYGRYRLPAPGANRWVRWGNDVLLVNVRTGRVLQVNQGFFW